MLRHVGRLPAAGSLARAADQLDAAIGHTLVLQSSAFSSCISQLPSLAAVHSLLPAAASCAGTVSRQHDASHPAAGLCSNQQLRGAKYTPQADRRRPPPARSGQDAFGQQALAPVMQQSGVVHIQSTRNNTILTLTDGSGKPQAWASAGTMGFKNARKATSYAAEAAAEKLAADAIKLGFTQVQLKIRGLGQGKQASMKTLHQAGLVVTAVHECTPLPHNGCRPPKKRRV